MTLFMWPLTVAAVAMPIIELEWQQGQAGECLFNERNKEAVRLREEYRVIAGVYNEQRR
jgi:hypothetical protein